MEALKDSTTLLEIVTKQEKKVEGRLSPKNNFNQQHLVI